MLSRADPVVPAAVSANNDAPISVWLVEDDASIRWVLERELHNGGMQLRAFESAEPALEALKGKRIALQFSTTPHILFAMMDGFKTTTYKDPEEILSALAKGEAEVHDGADHGFSVFGPAYHEAAAARSYERAQAMFDRELLG